VLEISFEVQPAFEKFRYDTLKCLCHFLEMFALAIEVLRRLYLHMRNANGKCAAYRYEDLKKKKGKHHFILHCIFAKQTYVFARHWRSYQQHAV